MRDVLTGIAVLLIVILTTALVAPYFIDWNNQRGFLESRLSHALGQKVTIGGNIDLKLLPTPYLVLDQVVVGGDDARMRLGVHHLDLELTVAPLFHGEFDITEARLEEPSLRLVADAERTLPDLPHAPAFSADVRFDRIHVSNGTLAVADTLSGRTFLAEHIDLDAEAASFAGPFKISGAAESAGARRTFRVASGSFEKGQAHIRLIVDEADAHPRLDIDGTLDVPTTAGSSPAFQGTIALAGHVDGSGDDRMPWSLSGPLRLDTKAATLDGGELRLGTDDAGVTLAAAVSASFNEHAQMAVSLSAKQLDLDRLSGPTQDPTKPNLPPQLPDPGTLRRVLAGLRPPIPTALDLTIDTATYGGEAFSGLALNLGSIDAPRQHLHAAADGVGGSHVVIDGDLAPAPRLFEGNGSFDATDLPAAATWLHHVAPWFGFDGSGVPLTQVHARGRIGVADDHLDATDVMADLDGAHLSGSASLDTGGTTPRLKAQISADRVRLGGLPSLDSLKRAVSGLDLDVTLATAGLDLSTGDADPVRIGDLRADLTKKGQKIEARDIHVGDIGGATLAANATLNGDEGFVRATLSAQHLDAATALLRRLMPGALAETLAARAPLLAPADLSVEAASLSVRDPTGKGSHLTIKGRMADSRFDLTAEPDPQRGNELSLNGSIRAPDAGLLLAQIGGTPAPAPVTGLGPAQVSLQASGPAGTPLDTILVATLGPARFDVTGRFNPLLTVPLGAGTLDVQSDDAAHLLTFLTGATPGAASVPVRLHGNLNLRESTFSLTNIDAEIAGVRTKGAVQYRRGTASITGALDMASLALPAILDTTLGPSAPPQTDAAWSSAPFGAPLTDPPSTSLTLRADVLQLGHGIFGRNARLDLALAPGVATITHASVDVEGGRVRGDVTLRRDRHTASIEGKVTLADVGLRLPSIVTHLDADLSFAGGGDSPQALVASLAGSGSATADLLRVAHADDGAIRKVFADVENDVLAVDPETVTRAFEQAAREPQRLGKRAFSLSLAAGKIRVTPVETAPETGDVAHRATATIDLVGSTLDLDLQETLRRLPNDWQGPPPSVTLHLSGPFQAPHVSATTDNLVNTLAARALSRETARVEAYEFDIRERAFFNARLDQERRRVEEAKAEADRKADAERRAETDRKAKERQAAEKAARAKANAARDEQPAFEAPAGPLALPGATR